ncbi:hypothetical protein [Dictyobacter vulcani]|nr:hypothetical protein [Dictyobacter vulcani]
MSSSHSSSPKEKAIYSKKKFNKRKRHLEERLQKARAAQERSEERLRLVQERLQVKVVRVQRLEHRLQELNANRKGKDRQAFVERIGSGSSVFAGDVVSISVHEEHVNERAAEIVQEAQALARDAREIALLAEDAARLAVERAEYAELRLEQSSMGRHLGEEYERMQTEAERAQIFARETAQAAEETEQLLSTFVPEGDNIFVDSEVEEFSTGGEISNEEILENNGMFDSIDKDEDAFAAVASLILADAEADQAAESEALLGAGREHTQDIQALLKQAQHTLALVRAAVEEGTLTGDDAVRALCAAEMEVTHTRSLLKNVEEGLEERDDDNEHDPEVQ